jgi:hypothetical protein
LERQCQDYRVPHRGFDIGDLADQRPFLDVLATGLPYSFSALGVGEQFLDWHVEGQFDIVQAPHARPAGRGTHAPRDENPFENRLE